jgi:superfamily II DNA or RNA helicase
MILRPYQNDIINDIKKAFLQGKKSIIMQAATGAGKTVMFTYMAKNTLQKGNSVLIITDRKELLKQAGGTLSNFGLNPEYLTAKTKKITKGNLYVAMSETIKRRLSKPDYIDFVNDFNLIIIDECHKASFDKIFENINNNTFVIGASATPMRIGNQKELKEFYDCIINGIPINKLIEQKFLSRAKYYGISLDFKKVKLKSGDFDPDELHKYMLDNKVFDGVIANYKQYANDTKALLFSASVKTSKLMCEMLNDAGIASMHVDANSDDRDEILTAFENNEFKILCNVGILTTGYDCPDIETIILNRATTSLPLYLQMCGRGSRIAESKTHFNILDFGGNINRHDFWEVDRDWILTIKKRTKKEGEVPTKECPGCGALLYLNARECSECEFLFPARKCEKCNLLNSAERTHCKKCGTELKDQEEKKIEVLLQSLNPKELQIKSYGFSVKELEAIRIAKDYKYGWVIHRLVTIERFKEYEKIRGYRNGWAEKAFENLILKND